MKGNKTNTFLFVTSVLSMVILLIGTTFSYFSVSNQSKYDAVAVEATQIKLALSVSPKYTGYKLIPTNDEDIMLAYESRCLDIYNNGACLAYELEISNFNKKQEIIGTIDFTVEGIQNLSYMVLDADDNVYLDKTSITGNTVGMPLGADFTLDDATSSNPTSKKFTLLIWLTNLDEPQEDYDAGGTFSGSVTYSSVYGSKLTASVSGFGEENGEVSELGGEES